MDQLSKEWSLFRAAWQEAECAVHHTIVREWPKMKGERGLPVTPCSGCSKHAHMLLSK